MGTTQHIMNFWAHTGPYRLVLDWRMWIDGNDLTYTGAWVVEKNGAILYQGGNLGEAMRAYEDADTVKIRS